MFTSRNAWTYGAVLLGIFLCSGCAAPGPKPQLSIDDQAGALSSFSLSLLAENAGDFESALGYLKDAIQRDPSAAVLYSSAVSVALQLEQRDEALRLARQFRAKRPDALTPRILEAQVCALTGRTEEAEALLRQALTNFPQEADSAIALARFLVAQKRNAEAIRTLETARKKHPEHANILYMLGTLHVNRARDLEQPPEVKRAILEGITFLEEALSLNPDNPQHWRQLGYACLAAEDTAKAQAAFEKAREGLPGDIQLTRQLLDIYILNGDIEPALALCEKLQRYPRTDLELWFQYVVEKIPDEQQDALTGYLEAFLKKKPHAAVMYYARLGSLYMDQKKLSEAERILQKAQEVYPANNRLRIVAGYLNLQQEQYEEAYQAFHQVRTDSPGTEWVASPLFTLNLVIASQKSGRLEEAAEALSAAYKNDLGVLNLYMQALLTGRTTVSTPSAIDLLKQFHTRSPNAIDALYYLSLLQADQEKYEEALNDAKRFKKLADGSASTNLLDGVFYYQYAVFHERTGKLDEAETFFREAMERGNPAMAAAAQNYIAYMWAERGEKLEMALGLIQQALAAEPDNAAFIDTLGWIYYMLGRYEEALVHLKEASELIQDDPLLWEHLGDTYLKLGDRQTAVKKWEKGLEVAPDQEPLIRRLETHRISPCSSPNPEDTPSDTPTHP